LWREVNEVKEVKERSGTLAGAARWVCPGCAEKVKCTGLKTGHYKRREEKDKDLTQRTQSTLRAQRREEKRRSRFLASLGMTILR
jgi:hypothetical protein